MIDSETRLADMTLGQLLEVLERRSAPKPARPNVVHGLEGIMDLYGCSKRTAARIKKSGVLDDAIFQLGRKITIDVDKALSIKPIQ